MEASSMCIDEIDISNPQPRDTPQILYKYRYFDKNKYHLMALEKPQLRFASARDFNDPYDSTLQYNFLDQPPGIQLKWAIEVTKIEFPQLNKDEIKEKAKSQLDKINNDSSHLKWFKKHYVDVNYDKFGICCLTPNQKNLLMWAHYSDNHKGFCIGFDTNKILEIQKLLVKKNELLQLLKIPYSDTIPSINFYESMSSDQWVNDLYKMLYTKSSHWSYEQEYRLSYWNHPNMSLDISFNVISEVILGCKISKNNKKKILLVISKFDSNISLFQAHKHSTKFDLHFEKLL